jgi:hypothetical protein
MNFGNYSDEKPRMNTNSHEVKAKPSERRSPTRLVTNVRNRAGLETGVPSYAKAAVRVGWIFQ